MESIKNIFKNNRCDFCNKKYGLIPFECRCGGEFCNEHRYSFMYYCEFDHTSLERERLRQSNPMVIQDKVANRI